MEPEGVLWVPLDPDRVAFGTVGGRGRDRDFKALGIAPVDFDPRPGSDRRDPTDAHGSDGGTGRTLWREKELFGSQTEDAPLRGRCGIGRKVDEVPGPFAGGATPDRRVASEVGEPGRAGLAVEFEGTTGLQEAAAFDDGEVVRSRDEIGRVMRDVEEGEVEVALEIPQETAQVAAQGGIEVGERFVEEDESGLEDEGATEGGARRLTAGEGGGEVMESRTEVEPVCHHFGTGAALVAVDALEAEGKFELFDQGQVRKESGRLRDPPAGAFLGRETGDVGTVEEDPSGIGELEAGDESEGGGLATAGRTDKEVMRARGDVDGEVLHRMDGAETFADSLKLDARHDGGEIQDFRFKFEALRCLPWPEPAS